MPTERVVVINADSRHSCATIESPRAALERSESFHRFMEEVPVALRDVSAPSAAKLRYRYDVIGHEAWVLVFDERAEVLGSFSADIVGGACSGESDDRFGQRLAAGIKDALAKTTSVEDLERAWRDARDRPSFTALYQRYEEDGFEVRGRKLVREILADSSLPAALRADADFLKMCEPLDRIAAFESGEDPSLCFDQAARNLAAAPGSPFFEHFSESLHKALIDEFDLAARRAELSAAFKNREGEAVNPFVYRVAIGRLDAKLGATLDELASSTSNEFRFVPLGRTEKAMEVLEKMRPLYPDGARIGRLMQAVRAAQ